MLKKMALVAAVAALSISTAQADLGSMKSKSGRNIEQIYTQCGLGGVLFGKSSPLLAIISNVTWDLGTTAAISDSVSPETCSSGTVRAAVLIKEAFPSLEKDLAAGQGAHLSALAQVASCPSVNAIRQDYATYAQSSTYRTATQQQNAATLFSIVDQHCAM